MTISSMTGFARTEGTWKDLHWVWELRSVNGRGLDMRLRLSNGFEKMEPEVRTKIKESISRGSLNINLAIQRDQQDHAVKINQELFATVLNTTNQLAITHGLTPPDMNTLLHIRGIVDIIDAEEDEEELAEKERHVVASFTDAINELIASRQQEGQKLKDIVTGLLDSIVTEVENAEKIAATQPTIIKQKLQEKLQDLLGDSTIDPERLVQEVALVAAKADVREEIDRLKAHVKAAHEILAEGGPIGRKLDFLVQEFNREANTLCSKSSDKELTNYGLSLKTLIEQIREQTQNIE